MVISLGEGYLQAGEGQRINKGKYKKEKESPRLSQQTDPICTDSIMRLKLDTAIMQFRIMVELVFSCISVGRNRC